MSDSPLDLLDLLAETADDDCGALVVFGGTVRRDDGVRRIDYSAYLPLAIRVLQEIEAEVCARFEVARCRIVHRIGAVALGELSVIVVVRAPHRGEAFRGAQYAIDELKQRLPVWKEEQLAGAASRFVAGVPLAVGEVS
ncbi:MAG TPA: molybdenum cofactor biosynthesis protein MoaE [Solimonas sp.]|nr:molybdenum cofactor biosynthesis protein MoaE [Solimonas sp.]